MTRRSTRPPFAPWRSLFSTAGLGLYLVALVFPLVFWYFHCTSFNGGDEAGYLSALDIGYAELQSDGFAAVPLISCGIPGSHIMLGPEMGLLPMLLCGGKVFVAYRATLFFFYLLVLLYTFLNVKLICRDKVLAVFATCIIGSAPWLVRHAQVFFNEIYWIAAVSAAVYHTIRCDGWQRKLHALAGGLAIGLALCVRPMETCITCLPLVCLAVARFRRGGIWEPASYAVGVAATAAILLLVRLNDRHDTLTRIGRYQEIVGGLFVLALIDWIVVRKLRGFKLWTLGAVFLPLLFWVPRVKAYFVHAQSCTFGTAIHVNSGEIPHATLLDFLKDFLLVVGYENLLFVLILLAALYAARKLSMFSRPSSASILTGSASEGSSPALEASTRQPFGRDANGYLWMALAAAAGVALTVGLTMLTGGFGDRRIYLGTYLVLIFGLGWLLAQFSAGLPGDRRLLSVARLLAGSYALVAIGVMLNCYVLGGTKPYGMGFANNPDTTYQDGVVHAVNRNVENDAVVIPMGVSPYINKDYAALLARLEKSRQNWIVDNRLVDAKDVDDAFGCLSTFRRGEYLVADMGTIPDPPTHKVYHALICRIVDSYRQAVAAKREVAGKTFAVKDRTYLLIRAQDVVAMTAGQSAVR